jgi:oxaloacetate decarboxylase gamma subunit
MQELAISTLKGWDRTIIVTLNDFALIVFITSVRVSIYRKEHTVSLVEQGLVLMVVGMAVVVAFLVILVFSTKSLSAVITKYFPEKEIIVKKRPGAAGRSSDAEIAAAVAAATAYSQASTN